MITRRLRPIGWVAGVAGAALCLYLVSLQVAAERAALESVERKITLTQRQIRSLETEFSARASLRQLEAYNQEVLALAAPKVGQYLANEVQLASYSPADGAAIGKPAASTALASAEATPPPAARPTLRPAVVTDVKDQGAPVIPAVRRPPLIQTVAMIEPVVAPSLVPANPKPSAKAPSAAKVALLDDAAVREIAREAAKERKAHRP
ncbi:MAG TPA: hypothetical protein VE567_07470 [Sphingomonas sp.]|nr:hypothetical protein [Sphingomonas sp.]